MMVFDNLDHELAFNNEITHIDPINDLAKRANTKLIETDNKRLAIEDFVRNLVDAIPDVFLILNEYRQVIFANDATLQMLGDVEAGTILGKRPGEMLSCEHAANITGGCGTSEACKVCGAFRAINESLAGKFSVQECRIGTDKGEALDFRVWATPLKFQGRSLTVFTLKDISDEKRRRVLERTFFHDIINTASIVATYTQILKMDPEMVGDVVDDMHHAIERLMNEINAQRHIADAENGDLSVQVEAFNVSDFINEIARQYDKHEVADHKTIRVLQDDACIIATDRTLLGRVIGNMVKNALEASAVGDTVTIDYDVQDGYVRFYVHNPTFMPRKVQLQIFRRSFSTKGAGRGIGTYSMRLLTEKYLRGQIGFTSTRQDGTTFFATYPLDYGAENEAAVVA